MYNSKTYILTELFMYILYLYQINSNNTLSTLKEYFTQKLKRKMLLIPPQNKTKREEKAHRSQSFNLSVQGNLPRLFKKIKS